MITTELMSRDLYLLTHDENGKPTLSHHFVWDGDRFMAARRADAAALNAKHGSTKADANELTAEQFRQLRSG